MKTCDENVYVEDTLSAVSLTTRESAEAWVMSDGTVSIYRCGEDELLASYSDLEQAALEWIVF